MIYIKDIKIMFVKDNNIYIGGTNVLPNWGKVADDSKLLSKEQQKEVRSNVIERIQEMFRDYLELDNVSFLFGTGSSIHLGAASIQNIPSSVEKDVLGDIDKNVPGDFKAYVQNIQKNLTNGLGKDEVKDVNGWKYAFDGEYYRNCDVKINKEDGKDKEVVDKYGEIDVPLESLLNYLIANLYVAEAEQENDKVTRLSNLISAIKKAMFNLCDVHLRTTSDRDLERIKSKGYKELFKKDKYLFHEKFLKSLLQRPLNLKRANIFTSNYDLAFEYAFDNIGVKYIDGFSGFHHRYFKPETFDYDIFYPGSTTSGKVQRIEKVVRYFKLHGSITWVKDHDLNASNVYGIKEMPIDLIKEKSKDSNESFDYGDLMIYPSAVKKSYTLDLPYSELIRQFSSAISQPQSVLFAIGYSFCDEHFNDIIYQALSNPSFTLIIVNFQKSEKSAEIKRLRDLKDPRIIILEGNDLGDFLTFSTELMPSFSDASSSEEVIKTLESLLKK